MSSRSVATVGMLTALVAALGFLLSGVPNIELMTLATFVSGALLGGARGAVVGAGAEAIFSGFNPYGMAPPPVFFMQVLGYAGVGWAGGLLGGAAGLQRRTAGERIALGAATGFLLTIAYDVLTNLGTAWSAGLDVGPTMVGGILFGLWHTLWNAAVFALAGPPLLAALRRRRERLI